MKPSIDILREIREADHLSQSDVAREFGFEGKSARQRIGKWESGEEHPSSKHRAQFIKYLAARTMISGNVKVLEDIWNIFVEKWNWSPLTDAERDLTSLAILGSWDLSVSTLKGTTLVEEHIENLDRRTTDHIREISATSPLLIGLLVDVSRSMRETLENPSLSRQITHADLAKTIELIVTKSRQYTKTPEGEELASIISLFAYGFGFGSLRKTFTNTINSFPIRLRNSQTNNIQDEPVRNLLIDSRKTDNSSVAIPLSIIDTDWVRYQKYVQAQFLDIGNGISNLYEGFIQTQRTLIKELSQPYFASPMVIVISNGNVVNSDDNDIFQICKEIKDLGVQILCLYIGEKNLTENKLLYSNVNPKWTLSAKRLFTCASTLDMDSDLWVSFRQLALDGGWVIPQDSKLFIQINQREMLEEMVELILKAL